MGILNENGGGFYMPVAPAGYGSNGGGLFGGDGSIWGLLLVLLLCGNGMWGGFGGGLHGYRIRNYDIISANAGAKVLSGLAAGKRIKRK